MKLSKFAWLLMSGVLFTAAPLSSLQAGEIDPIIEKSVVIEEEDEYPDENLWTYTKGTAAREKGEWEFKLRNISRFGKSEGSYTFHDFRPELEYGISDNWTIGASIWLWHHDYRDIPWGPMNEMNTDANGNGNFTGSSVGGFEIFTKYEFLNPFENWIGLALGVAYDHRTRYRLDHGEIAQDTVTPQLFLQKSMMDDKLQWAFTGKLELEQRTGGGILEEEIAPDLAMGISYNVARNVWLGVEARWQSDFLVPFNQEDGAYEPFGANAPDSFSPSNWDWGEWALGDQFQHGLYVGPAIHWNPDKPWWWTIGGLWQVRGWSADGSEASSNNKNWDEHEQFHLGVLFGYEWGGDE